MLLRHLFALFGGEGYSPAQVAMRNGTGGAKTELRSHERPSAASRSPRPRSVTPIIGRRWCVSEESSLGSDRTEWKPFVPRVVAPHRVEDAGHAARERDGRDALAPSLGDAERPGLEASEFGIR
jgi:hypothetical protein